MPLSPVPAGHQAQGLESRAVCTHEPRGATQNRAGKADTRTCSVEG